MSDNRNAFENLTQSGLMKIASKDDKTVTLTINAYNGSTNFSIFTNSGGKPWSVTLRRRAINNIKILLRNMQKDIKPCRQPITINVWVPEEKKQKETGMIAFGIDENMNFQIEISGEGLNGRHIFVIRNDMTLNFSNTTMTEKDIVSGAIETLIEVLTVVSPIAERFTSFKKTGFGGQNKGGSNNNGGRQGSFNTNGGNRQGSGTFGGDEDFNLAY